MPAKIKSPRYCRQVEKGWPDRAYTIIAGQRIHLGAYGAPESYERYTKAVSQSAGRKAGRGAGPRDSHDGRVDGRLFGCTRSSFTAGPRLRKLSTSAWG